MKVVLTFFALMISTILVAQDGSGAKPSTNSNTSVPASSVKKNGDKKVYYVDKRTKSAHNNSAGKSNTQGKKPLVRKSETQKKAVQK